MRLRVERFKGDDLLELLKRGASEALGRTIGVEQTIVLEACPHNYSVFEGEKVLLCGGVCEYWRNRGEAWAVFDPECKSHFVELHSIVKRFLEMCPVRRIEAAVDVAFRNGHRWVRALGFDYEATLKCFLPGGQDVHFYSRVRAN